MWVVGLWGGRVPLSSVLFPLLRARLLVELFGADVEILLPVEAQGAGVIHRVPATRSNRITVPTAVLDRKTRISY